MDYVIAIDLGGTKLCAAVVHRDGSVFWRKKLPVAAGTPATTIEQIVQVIQEAGAVSPAPDNGPKTSGAYNCISIDCSTVPYGEDTRIE